MSDWWKGAVIYQIYPRSFKDTSNNGVGDLPGITQKLEYIASLGVDAIWISPFFKSPMHDFGYDISDYCAVDPLFGNLVDFKELLEKAHSLNIKVIIDQVISHCSIEHPWFSESRKDKTNAKADWFVWADPKEDGSEPNNWLSFFGGSAWTFDESRGQYYFHNFLTNQPDLNFHNPEVQAAQLNNLKFWLDLGVDGFRLDVANFYFHDKDLRDNPIFPEGERSTVGVTDSNPYSRQQHIHSITQAENIAFIEKMRQLMDQYPNTTTMGEINGEHSLDIMAEYTTGDNRMHMAYTFDLLGEDCSKEAIEAVAEEFNLTLKDGWACWALCNHDVKRVVSRWGPSQSHPDFPLAAMALLLSLKGSVCLYQGEELGLPEGDVAFEDIQDPYGKPFWPEYKGRDGCRTPMVWDTSAQYAGFSDAKPWLPVDNTQQLMSVASQEASQTSVLNKTRQLITWRNQQPSLKIGEFTLLDLPGVLAWLRTTEEQQMLVVINLSASAQDVELPFANVAAQNPAGFEFSLEGHSLHLPAYQVLFATVD
ncbi:alpha-glucosidase family protein [Glaciecola siphonariae]|uniref:Alpha-glucosidase family protein n=1 Tax=Glaciecola siphonariae TaxID=521012 RepID=A0ABV9M1Y3_9ALTE